MNKAFLYIIFLILSIQLHSQNLVPNPSFEEYNYCPSSYGNLALPGAPCFPAYPIPSPQNWFDPNCTSPDYFNVCSTIPEESGVPMNFGGVQDPHTGSAYCGFNSRVPPNTQVMSEYIAVRLTESLKSNTNYCFSLWYNLADSSCRAGFIGAHFVVDTNVSVWANQELITNNPSLQIDATFASKTEWTNFQSTYTATGGEEFLIIGYFDSTKASIQVADFCTFITPFYPLEFYYYIDDISLIEESCQTDLNNIPNIITPNDDGMNDNWIITNASDYQCSVYNRWGTLVYESKDVINWNGKVNNIGNKCISGVYYYIIESKTKKYKGFIQLFD